MQNLIDAVSHGEALMVKKPEVGQELPEVLRREYGPRPSHRCQAFGQSSKSITAEPSIKSG